MTSRIEMMFLGLGLIGIAALVFMFVSFTDGINQDISAGTDVTADAAASPPAADVAPALPQDATVALGGPSIRTNADRDYLIIDFGQCTPGSGKLDLALASLTFEILGLDSSTCVLDYGEGDVPSVTCDVPAAQGAMRFDTHDKGVYLDKIQSYCKSN